MTCPICTWPLRRTAIEFGSNIGFRCHRCARFWLLGAKFITS